MELKVLAVVTVVLVISMDMSNAQGGTRITTECNRQLDLIFMLDASNSVQYENFETQKQVMIDVARTMDIRPGALRVGMVVFSTKIGSFPLTDKKNVVINGMREMEYLDRGTYTHLGIQEAINKFNERPRPGDVPKLLMIITDGSSVNSSSTLAAASKAKSQGITIYALGISSDVNREELEAMATSRDRVMYTPNFDNIKTVLEQAIKQACSLVVIPPPVTAAPTPPLGNHLCANSGSMTNGYGYVAHPGECDKYIQCYFNPATNLHIGVVRHCEMGLHYNANTMMCDDPKTAQCPFDPCKNDCAPYAMADSNRGYWACENKVSIAKCCCGDYESFVSGKGCVKNLKCKEECVIGKCIKGMCKKQPVWAMPAMYKEKLSSVYSGWMSIPCMRNQFDLLTCGCTASSDHTCFSEFETSLNSVSSLGQYVRSNNAQMSSSGATVGAGSMLHLDLHKGRGDEPVTIMLAYRENNMGSADTQILMSSSDNCVDMMGSLVIYYSNKYVMAYLTASSGQMVHITLPTDGFSANDVKELTFSYNNKYMTLGVKVNQIHYMETIKAALDVKFPCGFDIGGTTTHTGFNGLIQKISLYSCTLNRLY